MARQVLDNGVVLPSEYSDDWYDDMTSNLTKLDEVIGSNAEKLSARDVGEAAISNDYDDLDEKPVYNILRRASVTLTAGGTGNYTDLDSDSKIKAGDYVLDAANKLYSITAIDAANSTYTVSAAALFTVTDKAELGAAALSNDYDDLNNLPDYGILRFCSTAITDNSSVAFANISSVSKIAAGDFLLDTAAKLYQIASVDTVNETAAVTTSVKQLALDANVMHLSGNETAAGIKTFSDELIGTIFTLSRVRSKDNTNAYIVFRGSSQSDPGSLVIQANDGTNSTALHLVNKSLRPYSDNDVSLGTEIRRWINVHSYLIASYGTYFGNESSTNQRTNICLLANRDTADKSGAYITRFRQNRAQGALQSLDLQKIGFDVVENEVRTNNVFDIQCTDWLNDVPQRVNFVSSALSYSYGRSSNKALINDLNPGALSLPDLNNGLDISGYFTVGTTSNTYTALADGYISILTTSSSNSAIYWMDSNGIIGDTAFSAIDLGGTNRVTNITFPVNEGVTYIIVFKSVNTIVSAKFFPCLGNV